MKWTFWLYAITGLPWALCLAFYGLRSPWWRTWTGRTQVTAYAAVTVVLALAALLRILALPHEWALFLSVASLAAVFVAGVGQVVNVIRLQRRNKNFPTPRRRVDDHQPRR